MKQKCKRKKIAKNLAYFSCVFKSRTNSDSLTLSSLARWASLPSLSTLGALFWVSFFSAALDAAALSFSGFTQTGPPSFLAPSASSISSSFWSGSAENTNFQNFVEIHNSRSRIFFSSRIFLFKSNFSLHVEFSSSPLVESKNTHF